jgi:sulfur relay (sulfurtransferase) DsrF/TusC family protein
MPKRVAVVIAEDPTKTHRPVEALRIALGLSAGDHDTTVILLGKAALLLTDDTDDIVDVDILEKYRPSFTQLEVPFVMEADSEITVDADEFSVARKAPGEIRELLISADRTLVFS